MMRFGWHAVGVIGLFLACGVGLGGNSTGTRSGKVSAPVCDCKETHAVIDLTREINACEDRLKQASGTTVVTNTVSKLRVVPGLPKKCASDPPTIVPIHPTECAAGMVCLDEENHRALLKNLLRYEKWVNDVRDCEGGQSTPQP